jgi:uncharacterized protein (TIGR03067 family)
MPKRLAGTLLSVLVGFLPGCGGAASDKDKILGTWKAVSGEADGKPIEGEMIKTLTFVFKADNKLTLTEGSHTGDGTYTLDPSKNPKEIDIMLSEEAPGKGIYTLEGDELKICGSRSKQDRPKDFSSKDTHIFTFKRQK